MEYMVTLCRTDTGQCKSAGPFNTINAAGTYVGKVRDALTRLGADMAVRPDFLVHSESLHTKAIYTDPDEFLSDLPRMFHQMAEQTAGRRLPEPDRQPR